MRQGVRRRRAEPSVLKELRNHSSCIVNAVTGVTINRASMDSEGCQRASAGPGFLVLTPLPPLLTVSDTCFVLLLNP